MLSLYEEELIQTMLQASTDQAGVAAAAVAEVGEDDHHTMTRMTHLHHTILQTRTNHTEVLRDGDRVSGQALWEVLLQDGLLGVWGIVATKPMTAGEITVAVDGAVEVAAVVGGTMVREVPGLHLGAVSPAHGTRALVLALHHEDRCSRV